MKPGYFNDAEKEYIITDLLSPKRPWYNFVWNDKFISDIDQFGCAFKLVADCHLGNGNAALKTLKKMMSDNPDNHYDHSGVEPYAFTNILRARKRIPCG